MNHKLRLLIGFAILTGSLLVWRVFWPTSKDLTVELTDATLELNGKIISTLITNPKDGLPDFPRHEYNQFVVLPLKSKLQALSTDSTRTLHIKIPEGQLFAVWKPLILTAQNSGFKRISMECTKNNTFRFLKPAISATKTIFFYDKYDTSHQRASIFINPDSIIARRTNFWPYTTKFHQPLRDTAFENFLVQNEIQERMYMMGSRYSTEEMIALIDVVKNPKLPDGRIDLQIHPKSSCLEIIKFLTDFDNLWRQNSGSSITVDFYDDFLKFRSVP
ncbi:MAG: hypothetical protein IPO40_20680 [Fibrobacteres bacterium]|nr:hypothetical protein [Fibrobacterota bacterium]